MSRRGEITVECDVRGCHAERVYTPGMLVDCVDLNDSLSDDGWEQVEGLDICPDCFREGKV